MPSVHFQRGSFMLKCGIVRCLGLVFLFSAFATARAATELNVGYIPILPMSQLFVMEGEGWTKEAGLELKKTRFAEGPGIVQALASGTLDVVYFGIGPALVARSNGIDIRVLASNVVEQVALVVRGDLASAAKGVEPKKAIAAFTTAQGRKPKIATLPKGSVPDTVLRRWLIKTLGLAENDVEIVGMGADRVQQALLSGAVDGASILEPTVTLVLDKDPNAYVMAYGAELMPNQPGAVLAVRTALLKEKPDAIRKLVELHNRATEELNKDPKRAAQHVYDAVAKGLIPVALVEKALISPYSKFTANPHQIVQATKEMRDFQTEIGVLRSAVDVDELFDMTFYDSATTGK